MLLRLSQEPHHGGLCAPRIRFDLSVMIVGDGQIGVEGKCAAKRPLRQFVAIFGMVWAVHVLRLAEGSTRSQAAAPATHKAVAVRNEAGHPKCAAISGVSEAVTTAPNCPPMFITPETEPAELPARSAVTDQNELCDRYSAPAPPAKMRQASCALRASIASEMKHPERAMAAAANRQRPTRFPRRRVRESLIQPPSGDATAIAINGSIP